MSYKIEINEKEIVINRIYTYPIENVSEEDLDKVLNILKRRCDEEMNKEKKVRKITFFGFHI